jgi:hypothetical protein
MITVAALGLVAGLVLGFSSNVRMLILVVLMMSLTAFVVGLSQGFALTAVGWSVTALVSTQVGYITMILLRATWSVAQAKFRQPVPY